MYYNIPNYVWKNVKTLRAKTFTCGFCGKYVSSNEGYFTDEENKIIENQHDSIYICPGCNMPTFFPLFGEQYPSPLVGKDILSLPVEVELLYKEARLCFKEGCYTATVMVCRKLLMNIAVQQGARENVPFTEYVNYLFSKGFIPPNGKGWVDQIRLKGNEANHEIILMEKADADLLLPFIEMLLTLVFEFPNKIPK